MAILMPLIAMGEIGWFQWHTSTASSANSSSSDNDNDKDDSPVFLPARNHSYLDLTSLPASTQALLYDTKNGIITTPQHQALTWIENDPLVGIVTGAAAARLHVQPLDALAATQRFVLATLYYATNGPDWAHASYYYDDREDAVGNDNKDQFRNNFHDMNQHHQWLDVGLNECDWFGIHPLFVGNYSVCNRYHQLHALRLHNHNLTGKLPVDELGLLSNLKHLDIGHNALTGTLSPTVWKQWKNLETWDVAHNAMTGSLPSELGHLTNSNGLHSLIFKYNSFTGSIPTEMGLLVPRLTKLDLVANHLTGSIPSELGGVVMGLDDGYRALEHLSLSGNRFTGLIPSELGLLSQLTSLGLNDLDLTPQTMPDEICALQRTGRLQKLAVDCEIVTCGKGCDCTCISPPGMFHKDPAVVVTSRTSKKLFSNPTRRVATTATKQNNDVVENVFHH